MSTFQLHDTVGDVVARRPALSRVFEEAGIDYCCGGKKTLVEVCRTQKIDPEALLALLDASAEAFGPELVVDAAAMTLSELADHIEDTHHEYLRAELPRLDAMAARVTSVHGDRDPRLHGVREAFFALKEELTSHMLKEEQVLFPLVRELEAGGGTAFGHCGGSLAFPIRQMEREHDFAGSALAKIRELTDGYTPPADACNTYRALLDGLAHLERDLHEHIHKENNVLFPRALAREREAQVS